MGGSELAAELSRALEAEFNAGILHLPRSGVHMTACFRMFFVVSQSPNRVLMTFFERYFPVTGIPVCTLIRLEL